MAAPDPLYTTRFTARAHVYQPSVEECNEARASLRDLTGLLPAGIDPEKDMDIVYIVGDLAVAGLLNLNDDGVTIEDALGMYRQFERRQCNVEHNRKQIVGYILRAAISEFGTNRILTDDEARASGKPYNIVTVAALWRVANKDLCDFILQAGAPSSPDEGALSLSFEVGFNGYDIVALPPGSSDLSEARVLAKCDGYDTKEAAEKGMKEFEKYEKLLRINKGSGKISKTGERVGRILRPPLLPLGQGVVTVPAAAVKGIVPILSPSDDTSWSNSVEVGHGARTYSTTQFTLAPADAQAILDYAGAVPDDHLYTDAAKPGEYGRETEPHITAVYGLKCDVTDCTEKVAANHEPVSVVLGTVSAFHHPDKPYDVLKVGVESDTLHALHHDVKANVDHEDLWPEYQPHITIAYLKKGMAPRYVGDACFAGKQMTFPSLTFRDRNGTATEIPLGAAKQEAAAVYIQTTSPAMGTSTASKVRVKIPAGLQEKAKKLNYPKADVTLSDGRVLKGVTVFSGEELELDKELANLEGVVITDMTPGVPPGVDESPAIHPHVDDEFPTKTPEARKEDAQDEERKHILQNLPYTDAILRHLEAAAKALSIIDDGSGVSASKTNHPQSLSSMKLEDLKQLEAKVKTAAKPEEVTEVFANVALFVEEITKASEKYAKAAKEAEEGKAKAEKDAEDAKKDAAEAKKMVEDMKKEKEAEKAEAKFQERMAALASEFDLDDEARAFVIEQVKACADDAAFAKYLTIAKKLFKTKSAKSADDEHGSMGKDHDPKIGKDTVESTDASMAADKKEEKEDKKDEEAKAAANVAIASAKANPTDKLDIDTVGAVAAPSLLEQYKAAFAAGVSVGGRKIKDLAVAKR